MLPPSLSYMAEKLGQYETNTVKVFPQGDIQDYTEGQIMEYILPSNSLVDLDSLFVSFAAGVDDENKTARLPADIHSLIDRITVKIGSLTVDDGARAWGVFKHKYDKLTGKSVSALSHPEIIRAGLNNAAPDFANPNSGDINESIDKTGSDFVWDSFHTHFLGTCQPRILDTSILPEIRIQFHLAREVCPSGGYLHTARVNMIEDFAPVNPSLIASPRAKYIIQNPSLKINCISFGNASYDDMISAQMKSGPLIIPFKKLYSFTDMAYSNMVDFNVQTNSLDKIHFEPSDTTYKSGNWTLARATDNNCEFNGNFIQTLNADDTPNDNVAGVLRLFAKQGPIDINDTYVDNRTASSFVGKRAQTDRELLNAVTYQVSINNTLNPQFKADITEMFQITRASVSEDMVCGHKQSFAEWTQDHCHGVIRFNRPGSTTRTPSGLNTQNSSAHMTLIGDNLPGECQMDVFAETTAMLYAFPGRAVSLQN